MGGGNLTTATSECDSQRGNTRGLVKCHVTSSQHCASSQADLSYPPEGSLMVKLPQDTKQVVLLRTEVLLKLRENIFFPLLQGLVWIPEAFKLPARLTDVKEPQGFIFRAFLHLIQQGKESLIKSQIDWPSKKT